MAQGKGSPTERILRLAAYLDERRHDLTLSVITENVPGYDDGSAPRDSGGELLENTAQWEALRKTFRRDLEDLRENFGIVVTYDDATHSYRLEEPFFSPHERRALISAAAIVDVEGINDDPDAVGELGAAVDDHDRRVVLRVHSHVVALCAAIGARQRVAFVYNDRQRTVEPYAVGVWRNRWYLTGLDTDAGSRRRFRLDRIGTVSDPAVVVLEPAGRYAIPDDFDRTEVVRLDPNDWGSDPAVRARVAVDPDHVHSVSAEFTVDRLDESGERPVVEIAVRDYASFVNRLLNFREHVVLLEPAVLVDRLVGHLRAIAEGA